MKRLVFFIVLFLIIALSGFVENERYNSFIPGELWLDNNNIHINAHGGGILYDNGVYYWFGQHMIEGEAGNQAQVGVHCYSSKDLYNWKDEGISLAVMPENSGSDIEKGCILERPKVIYNKKTKKYVMWFHLEIKGMGYNSARSGVAVSDRIIGPYEFIRSERPNAGYWPVNVLPVHQSGIIPSLGKRYNGGLPAHPDSLNIVGRDFEGGQMARDMTLFVDDDGTAYHIYSSEENSTLHISQLSDDYLSHSGKWMRFFVNRYMEASSIFKFDTKYYFFASGCTGWAPNAARSAVASSIWGPWEELGNPCVGDQADITFGAQSTYILPIVSKPGTFIFMADQWRPENAIDGRYVWLPIEFNNGKPVIRWQTEWKSVNCR